MKLPGALSKLTAEQHSYLISLLSMGKNDADITDAIHEKGWCTEVKRPTLLRTVNRWRKNKGQEAVLKQVTDAMTNKDGKLKRQIDVVEELTALVVKQKKRVEKMSATEDANEKLLLQTVTDELKVLMTMLQNLGKFQLDTGIVRKVRTGEVEGDYADVTPAEDEGSEEIYSEEDRRLIEAVKKRVYPQLTSS